MMNKRFFRVYVAITIVVKRFLNFEIFQNCYKNCQEVFLCIRIGKRSTGLESEKDSQLIQKVNFSGFYPLQSVVYITSSSQSV